MSKFKSVKFWALVFCCVAIMFIVYTGRTEFMEVARVLSWAPLSYFAANVAQDYVFKDKK